MTDTLQEIAALPFYVAGWLTGVAARALAFARDALIAGYRRGRGIR